MKFLNALRFFWKINHLLICEYPRIFLATKGQTITEANYFGFIFSKNKWNICLILPYWENLGKYFVCVFWKKLGEGDLMLSFWSVLSKLKFCITESKNLSIIETKFTIFKWQNHWNANKQKQDRTLNLKDANKTKNWLDPIPTQQGYFLSRW